MRLQRRAEHEEVLTSGMWRRAVWQKFIYVSEDRAVSKQAGRRALKM
jgi:hypothetical protein